jgi:hypothetical protein
MEWAQQRKERGVATQNLGPSLQYNHFNKMKTQLSFGSIY